MVSLESLVRFGKFEWLLVQIFVCGGNQIFLEVGALDWVRRPLPHIELTVGVGQSETAGLHLREVGSRLAHLVAYYGEESC